MGSPRPRPKHLAKKLLQIRQSLGVSQRELLRRLGVSDQIRYTSISKYELDKNEPPLAVLLAYSRLAQIPLEQMIDDDMDPARFRDALAKESELIENFKKQQIKLK
jgi:transcriptional regulator with XRE-family HTH domain